MLAYFGIDRGAVVVRLPSEAEDLPQKDAIAPDVTVRGELELAQTFRSIPTYATHSKRPQSTKQQLLTPLAHPSSKCMNAAEGRGTAQMYLSTAPYHFTETQCTGVCCINRLQDDRFVKLKAHAVRGVCAVQ